MNNNTKTNKYLLVFLSILLCTTLFTTLAMAGNKSQSTVNQQPCDIHDDLHVTNFEKKEVMTEKLKDKQMINETPANKDVEDTDTANTQSDNSVKEPSNDDDNKTNSKNITQDIRGNGASDTQEQDIEKSKSETDTKKEQAPESTKSGSETNTESTKTTEPKPEPKPEPKTKSLPSFSPTSLEYEYLAQINAKRQEAGVAPLIMDNTMCALAYVRAQEISTLWSHTRPNGQKASSVYQEYGLTKPGWNGENLAYASVCDVEKTVDSWMNSSGHRENILRSEFSYCGLAVYFDGSYYYIANLFSN